MIVLADSGGQPINQLEIAGRMQPGEFLDIALQLSRILEEIHARQVIHKNISPANISFNPSSAQVKLTNFGYASLVSRERVPFQSPYRQAEFLAYTSPELTGRMNRTVDYRTDYYSLGATLYELLTGTPPFISGTPLELVHAHLALLPDPPQDRMEPWSSSPVAFERISAILLKLLAKNPEDRYQTPSALQADLRECSFLLQTPVEAVKKTIFIPGRSDRPADLNFPQMMIGRQEETDTLVEAFQRTVNGPRELVLVSGEAGVGKTTLVNQLIRPATEHKGLFLYAKADQARHLEIYPLLIDLLEEFCRLILSEPAYYFKEWQERIQDAVAPHGQLLTDLCPQLESIIGPQPPVEPVDNESIRPRFHQVVTRFFQAICRPDHHIVVFLDDLQWIGPDSFQLWKSILSNSSLHNLLIVAAFRDDQLETDPFIQYLLQELETIQEHLIHIQLQNLKPPLIQRMIAATLSSDLAEVSGLSSLVYQRTEGNPYYTIEFLKSLYKDQLLVFRLDDQKWDWDADRIDEYSIANNVVDFFVHEIVGLDPNTQQMLQYAALLGRHFDAADLLAVLGQDQASTLASSLWRAMMAGLIYPMDENYRFLVGEYMDGPTKTGGEPAISLTDLFAEHILFEFQHDRVQQAAIAMLDDRQLLETSLRIGWMLLEKAEQAAGEIVLENLLAIVDHLNTGSALIEVPAEAFKAARLNMMAGNQAREAGAFDTASRYLDSGVNLLPAESWEQQYTLTFNLYVTGAEVAFARGDLARAETLVLAAEPNVRILLDRVRIIKIRMDIHMIRTKVAEVIELGIAAMHMLGFDLELIAPPVLMPEQIMQFPVMTDPAALEISRLAETLISAAFTRNDPRFAQIVFFHIDLFKRFGNPPAASYVYVAYSVVLLRQFENIESGCRVGRMALELAEREKPSRTLYAVRFVYYSLIYHWMGSAREGVSALENNIQPAFEAGNLRHAINFQDLACQNSLFAGLPLEQVSLKQAKALHRLEGLSQTPYTQRLRIWSQVVLNLIGDGLHTQEISGSRFDEEEVRELEGGHNLGYLFSLYAARAYLNLLFRDPHRALKTSLLADELRGAIGTYLIFSHHILIYSLALLSAGLDESDRAARLTKVEENLHMMRLWAAVVPENFLHQLELVEAELARCLGHDEAAAKGYERAIRNAMQNGYIHQSALAAELASEFYLAREAFTAAKEHIHAAYSAYQAWGSQAKINDLERRYPEWLPPGKEIENRQLIPSSTSQPRDEFTTAIDLHTILKASMELSQETNLEDLLRKLMAILIENTGAQNGSLLLIQNDRWQLRIQASTDTHLGFSLESTPLEYLSPQFNKTYLPISIIHYVINLKEPLVLEDASATRQFNRDAYIQTQRPKSILCIPLLNQGTLTGVIYLENKLTSGVFNSDRLEIVRLLSGQAAVSIEKTRLYENMEMLVEERTRELSAANRRLQKEIDERIRFEKALRLSEERYRTVFENTGTAMALMEHGFFTLVNEKYVELTGYSREELENHFDTFKIVAPVDLPRLNAIRQAVMENPLDLPYSMEFQLLQKSGSIKSVIATSTHLPGSESIIASVIDITRRKSAEEARRYNEALLRKVLDILPVGVWIMDKETRIISGNPEALRIWSGAQYVDWSEFEMYKAWKLDTGEQINADNWAGTQAIIHGKITLDEELEIEAFDGTRRIILNSALPISTEVDGLVGGLVVNQDITERKHAEAELQAAHGQLSTLLEISQSIVSTLDLDRLLNLIMEQLGKVIPYDAAAILMLEQGSLKFRMIRGPAEFQRS